LLDWYTAMRDIIVYMVVIFATAALFIDVNVQLWNPIIMFGIYLIYLIFMRFNTPIERY